MTAEGGMGDPMGDAVRALRAAEEGRAGPRPAADPPSTSVAQPVPAATPASVEPSAWPVVVSADAAGHDGLGRDREAAFLAGLLLHKGTQTPLCVGLIGPAGVGKSDLLVRTAEAADALAARAGASSPFCAEVVVARLDAERAGPDLEAWLAGAVQDALAPRYPALATELQHAGADPQEAFAEAQGRLDATRHRLDAERQALEGLSGRDARLMDSLIDNPGTLVDGFARAKRSRIERSFRAVGASSPDPVGLFKELVREVAEAGPGGRLGLLGRAFWGMRPQRRLLGWAVALAILAWGVGVLRSDQNGWIGAVRDMGDKSAPVADWLAGHVGWLGPLQTVLLLGVIVLLLTVVVRAARFALPISRGADLLLQEYDTRRRDLSGLIAHQTRRVDGLSTEAERAAEAVREAERRLDGRGIPAAGPDVAKAGGSAPDGGGSRAQAMFGVLAAAMANRRDEKAAPARLILALDGLDQRSPGEAAALLLTLRRLTGPGSVSLIAADRGHLMSGFGDTGMARAGEQLARCVQVPYRVGRGASAEALRAQAERLLDGSTAARTPEPARAPDPAASPLDAPWRAREREMVLALVPFAGDTPRGIKRYVNLYRIARADPRLDGAPLPVFTALALALSLDAHGFVEDLSALHRVSQGDSVGQSPVLRDAVAAAREASGQPVELAQAQRGLAVAATYTARG